MPELRAGLLQACDDRRLFDFPLWPSQRKLLESVEDSDRIHVWALGRRSGKSTMAALICAWDALLRPELDKLVRPGETRYAVAVATNVSQARLILQAAQSVVERSPLHALITGQTEDELRFELPSGAKTAVKAFPCSSRGGRGWPISCLVMDEAAHFLTENEGDRAAERVWESLTPSTAQFMGHAKIILSSTPYGQSGLFADMYGRTVAGEVESAIAHHATTLEVNPTIEPRFLEGEERRDPESYRSEYLAEFVGSGDSFLDFERIEILQASTAQPSDAKTWVAGLDPAFSRDPFGLALVGRTEERKLLLGPVLSLRSSGEFAVVDEVARLVDEYNAQAITDQFSSAAVVDRLANHHGLRVRVNAMTAQSKTQAFQALRSALYDGSLLLPDHPSLIAELRRLRSRYTSGQCAVMNPRVGGSHGDMAQALALAVNELSSHLLDAHSPVFAEPAKESRWGTLRPGILDPVG